MSISIQIDDTMPVDKALEQVARNGILISNTNRRHKDCTISCHDTRWQVAIGPNGNWSTVQPSLYEAVEAAERSEFN